MNRFATAGLIPDRTLLLRVSTMSGRTRQGQRALAPDPIELEDEGFFERVAATYEALARAEPARIRQIDAEQGVDEVLRDALAAIEDLLAPGACS